MKTFGIRISIFVLIFLNFLSKISSQNSCPCNQNECGDIISSFKLGSDLTVVCDGYEFLVLNNSTSIDVSYYIWDWGDGTRDSVTNTAPLKHIYNISEDDVCKKKQSVYEICLLVVKNCGVNFSCHSNRSPVTVIHRPKAKFNYSNSVCIDKKVDFNNISCNIDESLPNAYLWTFHDGTTSNSKNTSKTYSSPGTYTVKLKVKNSCGEHEITQIITVVKYPDAVVDISASAQDSVVCVGDVVTLINQSNQWSNIKWKFPVGNINRDTLNWKISHYLRKRDSLAMGLIDSIPFIDTLKIETIKPGIYTFEMNSSNACGTVNWKYILRVVTAPSVSLNTPSPFCETATYTPVVNVNGDVNSYNWSFPGGIPTNSNQKNPGPITYNTPGTYTITLIADAECGTIIRTMQLVVNSRDPVSIINPNKIFCQSSSPDTLTANRVGGKWSGQGITDTILGVFNPNGLNPGDYIITYTIGPTGCQSIGSIKLQVVASESVVVNDAILCENTPITQLIANPSSGNWSGINAVSNLGLFDPNGSGVGVFPINYKYTDLNGCVIQKNLEVTVEAFPTISSIDTSIVCLGGGAISLEEILNINTNPVGGNLSFIIDGISVSSIINLADYNISVLPVTIIYIRNLCEVRDSTYIQFIKKPLVTVTPDTILCINVGSFVLSANISGGSWSGPGIEPNTGIIDLTTAGEGNKTYTYSFQPNTSCAQNETVNIDIKDPGINLNAGPNQQACEGISTFTLTGNSPANGIWSGVAIDPLSGNIDLKKLILDSLYTYTYCLSDASVQGCEACKSKTFIIHALPNPIFVIDGLTCINEDIIITNQTNGINNILFDLGDGTTSISDMVNHQYTSKGTYTVSLQVTNQYGCKASKSQQIYVTSKPISAFALLDDEGCAPFELLISNQSSGDGISYQWVINNINYSQETLPTIFLDKITKDSTFIISLAVTNQCGTIRYSDSVLVHPYPIANFGVSEQSGCSPLIVDFANNSLGNPTAFFWDMGNGNTYNDSIPPTQTYTTSADKISTYDIFFVGTNDCGVDSLKKTITIYPPDITAFIEAPGLSLCQYDTLTLSAFSTPGAINTWKLIAPDGTLSGTSGDIAIFKMTQSGSYTAILFASRCGSDSDTITINVLPAPFVDFELPPFVCVGSTVNFTNLGIGIGGVSWDYGDGITDASGVHVYDTAGIFIISLTGYSLINNCPFGIVKRIRVIGLPTASFTPSTTSGCEPLEISFVNNSTLGSNYDWNFGDMTSNSSSVSPKHTFHNDGSYQVKLTVYDDFGCFSDTSIFNIIVHPKPESNFSFPIQKYCHRYDSIPFTNLSIGSVGQEWIIEDLTFNTVNFTWLPKDSGSFNVILIAESTFACIDSSSKTIDILPSPNSNFISDKDSGCEDLIVEFTNTSTAAKHYIWDLNNATSSVEKDLNYTFTIPGTYVISLISLSDNGCPADTIMNTITVHPKPIASFDIQKDSVCGVPMRVAFTNNSIDNVDNVWSVNDLLLSQDPNFDKVFNTASKNDVKLVVQNEFLCADTLSKTLDIYLQPIADFLVNDIACEGDDILLENNSINAVSYIWNIEGQKNTTNKEPKLVFEVSGIYNISLIAVYNEFCKDTFSLASPIHIFDKPQADFDYQGDYDDNILGEIRFNNLSLDFDRSFWKLGDGNTSDEENPSHEYNINRNLLVTLNVFNDNNGAYTCIDSITKPIAPEWITTFFAPNALSPEYGEGDVKVFKPVGIGLAAYQISIYSPWGQAVWCSDKLENTSPIDVWDGTYQNTIVPQGAYSWIANITFVNGFKKVYKGSVTVVR